jgi:hypothetical protein
MFVSGQRIETHQASVSLLVRAVGDRQLLQSFNRRPVLAPGFIKPG